MRNETDKAGIFPVDVNRNGCGKAASVFLSPYDLTHSAYFVVKYGIITV